MRHPATEPRACPSGRRLAASLAAVAVAALVAPAGAAGAPVNDPITFTPERPRATVVLVHAGGWGGPDRRQQEGVWERVSPALAGKGHRVISLDYGAGGVEGLAAVVRAVDAERAAGARTLCLYGESAGGHLALLAAALHEGVDCVASYGAPTDFAALRDDVAAHPEERGWAHVLHDVVEPVFGTDPEGWAPWEPARHVGGMAADLLVMRSADDPLIPPGQVGAVADRVPTARRWVAPPAAEGWVHGTAEPRAVLRRVVGLVERAVEVRKVTAAARRTGCADVDRRLVRGAPFRSAVGCLVGVPVVAGGGRRGVRVSLIGPVTPATVADAVRRSRAARRLLGGRIALRVTPGAVTRIRVTRAGRT